LVLHLHVDDYVSVPYNVAVSCVSRLWTLTVL